MIGSPATSTDNTQRRSFYRPCTALLDALIAASHIGASPGRSVEGSTKASKIMTLTNDPGPVTGADPCKPENRWGTAVPLRPRASTSAPPGHRLLGSPPPWYEFKQSANNADVSEGLSGSRSARTVGDDCETAPVHPRCHLRPWQVIGIGCLVFVAVRHTAHVGMVRARVNVRRIRATDIRPPPTHARCMPEPGVGAEPVCCKGGTRVVGLRIV